MLGRLLEEPRNIFYILYAKNTEAVRTKPEHFIRRNKKRHHKTTTTWSIQAYRRNRPGEMYIHDKDLVYLSKQSKRRKRRRWRLLLASRWIDDDPGRRSTGVPCDLVADARAMPGRRGPAVGGRHLGRRRRRREASCSALHLHQWRTTATTLACCFLAGAGAGFCQQPPCLAGRRAARHDQDDHQNACAQRLGTGHLVKHACKCVWALALARCHHY